MKFLVPNYSCSRTPDYGDYHPQIPVLSVLCPQLNLLNPPEKKSWVRHCSQCMLSRYVFAGLMFIKLLSRSMNYVKMLLFFVRC